MKRNYKLLSSAVASFSLVLLFSSCIKEELPNAEADITHAQVEVENGEMFFYQETDKAISIPYAESNIVFKIRPTVQVGELAPVFKITEGASISPASGSMQDFSQGPVKYTVTSQDKKWTRVYNVSFAPANIDGREDVLYGFEHSRLEPRRNKYYEWYELDREGGEINMWASGNAGFAIVSSPRPELFPTSPIEEGYQGKGVVLTTRSTGFLGGIVKKPIAAGNLFTGSFDVSKASSKPLESTQFGTRINRIPLRFSGYYKYKPGTKLQDKNKRDLVGETDQATIYAVLYRNQNAEGEAITLDGSNIQSSEHIVGHARLGLLSEVDEWTHFDLPFTYTTNIDEEALAQMGYSLAIVATSSARGAEFIGAVGSTLWIDEFSIKYYKP